MLPGRINRLSQHKYEKLGIEALKLAAIYGANGAGKSNLIKSIAALREIVVVGDIPREITTEKFKLCAEFGRQTDQPGHRIHYRGKDLLL